MEYWPKMSSQDHHLMVMTPYTWNDVYFKLFNVPQKIIKSYAFLFHFTLLFLGVSKFMKFTTRDFATSYDFQMIRYRLQISLLILSEFKRIN